MGGNNKNKKEKKSSSSSEDDACANCTKLTQLIENYTQTIESLTARIETLENLLTKLQNQPKSEVEQNDNITDRVRAVEELVEERTNRQLRKTLVIRGIPEQQHEKWSDTDSTSPL